MDKQKEIEKMAKIIQKGEMDRQAGELNCKEFSADTIVEVGLQRLAGAKALVNAGYGDVKQAQLEVLEKLKDKIDRRCRDRGATDIHKLTIEYQTLNKVYKTIDELVKEVCGE